MIGLVRLVPATVVALAVAAVAASPLSAAGDNVVVAGAGQLPGGASVAVAAVASAAGVSGHLRVESAPGFLFVSEVTCVRVVGERVLVGGTIVSSSNPATIGNTSLLAVEDDGVAGDRTNFAFSNSGLDACPVFELPLHIVSVGNFVVVGGGD
jgi:hypothetical protein